MFKEIFHHPGRTSTSMQHTANCSPVGFSSMINMSDMASSTSAKCSKSSARLTLASSRNSSGISLSMISTLSKDNEDHSRHVNNLSAAMNTSRIAECLPVNTLKVNSLPLQEIDHTLEVVFSSHWDLERSCVHFELCTKSLHDLPWIGTSTRLDPNKT